MIKFYAIALLLFSFIPFCSLSQEQDSLVKSWDSVRIVASSFADTSAFGNSGEEIYEAAKLDFKSYFQLLRNDFTQQLTKPLHADRKDWARVGGFAVATGAVAMLNRPINRLAINLAKNNRGVASASNYITNFGGMYEVYTLAGFYSYGLIFKSQKAKNTALLATQAYITSTSIAAGIKYVTAQQRPYHTDPYTKVSGPVFHGPFYVFKKRLSSSDYASFPSGHTTAAFSAATVYAMEYRDKPLIPIVSYSAATLIGLSRLTENKHWPIDVFVGGMLGYLSGRQVVKNYHRYSRAKQAQRALDRGVTFNLQYFNGQVVPGMVYKF